MTKLEEPGNSVEVIESHDIPCMTLSWYIDWYRIYRISTPCDAVKKSPQKRMAQIVEMRHPEGIHVLQIACCTYDHFYTPNATKNRNLNLGSFFWLHHLHPYSPIVFFSIGSMGSFLTPWGGSYFFVWSSLNSCRRILCGACISTCWELRHLLCPWWVFILYTVLSLTTLKQDDASRKLSLQHLSQYASQH